MIYIVINNKPEANIIIITQIFKDNSYALF